MRAIVGSGDVMVSDGSGNFDGEVNGFAVAAPAGRNYDVGSLQMVALLVCDEVLLFGVVDDVLKLG